MSYSYFYVEGVDGRHYCYAKTPTFTCPMAEPVEYVPNANGEGGEHRLKSGLVETFDEAASALSMGPVLLGKVLKTAHQRKGTERLRVDDRLTDLCAVCGHRMERLGFRVWIEHLPTEEDTQSRIANRLGFSGWRTVDGSHRYMDTKKEAQQWARDEAELVRA